MTTVHFNSTGVGSTKDSVLKRQSHQQQQRRRRQQPTTCYYPTVRLNPQPTQRLFLWFP